MATILVTRPEADAERTAARLRADGHEVILSSVLILRELDVPPPEGRIDAIAVASANARWLGRGDVRKALASRPVFAVGDHAADVVRGLGYDDVRSAKGAGVDLAELIARDLAPPALLLAPVGRVHGEDWMATLRERGFEVAPVIVYDAEAADQLSTEAVAGLRYDIIDAVLHYSTRTALTFVDLAERGGARDSLTRLKHVCLSREIADSLPDDLRARAFAAEAPNEDSLFAALRTVLADGAPVADVIENEETPARPRRSQRQRTPRIIDGEAKVVADATPDASADANARAETPQSQESPGDIVPTIEAAAPASSLTPSEQDSRPAKTPAQAFAAASREASAEHTQAQAESAASATAANAASPETTTQRRLASPSPPPASASITGPLLAGGFAGAAAGAIIAFLASSILAPPRQDLDARLSLLASRNDVAAAQQKVDAATVAFGRDRDALRAEIAALAKKLDEAPAPAAADDPDARRAAAANEQGLQALAQRMQALERRADEIARATASIQPAANDVTAVVRRHALAGAVAQSLARGAAYRTELDALKSLGASADQIAALDGFANGGAPSPRILDDDFRALAPRLLRQARNAAPNESLVERMTASLRQLVRIRPVGDAKGDSAESLIARIEASLQRGGVADAVAAFDKLPESVRTIGGDWRKRAGQRAAADAAAQAMLDAAARALSAPSN